MQTIYCRLIYLFTQRGVYSHTSSATATARRQERINENYSLFHYASIKGFSALEFEERK